MHSFLWDASESQTFAVFLWNFSVLVDGFDTPILRNASVANVCSVLCGSIVGVQGLIHPQTRACRKRSQSFPWDFSTETMGLIHPFERVANVRSHRGIFLWYTGLDTPCLSGAND